MSTRPDSTEEPTIAQDATRHRAPDALRTRIRASLAATERERRRPLFWRALGLGAAFAMATVITWNLALMQPGEDERIAQQVVTAHVRSLMAPGHLNDVASTDQHTVKPWFTGKVDFAPPVADFPSAGFELIGGRLDYIDGHAAAAVTYRHRLHVVNFFVWPEKDVADTAPHVQNRQGYSLVGWARGGMRYCVVADVSPADLQTLAELLRGVAG